MKKKKSQNLILLPMILALGFVPLIVHEFNYDTHLSVFDWFPDSAERQTDFFLAYKSFAIMILGAIMLLTLIHTYTKKKKLSFEPAFYFLFAYAVLVVMSALFSNYRAYAFRGGYEMFEPVWVVLSYIIFCCYTCHYVQTKKQVSYVLHFAGIGIMLVSLIGLFQYFHMDFFKTTLGKMLITNPSRWDNLDQLTFVFGDGAVYTTLYNVDFLSFYYGLLLPIILALVVSAKKLWQRILYAAVAVIFIICIRGSGADSGILALILTAVVALYLLLSRSKKALRIGIGAGVVVCIAGIVLCRVTPQGQAIFTRFFGSSHYDDSYLIRGIETNDDNVTLDINGQTLVVSYEISPDTGEFQLFTTDGEGNALTYTASYDTTTAYTLDDASYSCVIYPTTFDDSTLGFQISTYGKTLYFAKLEDNTYYYMNSAGKFVKFPQIQLSHMFYDDFVGRGFIWKRVLPLLKKYILFGIGANNFIFAYPQDDYLLKINYWGNNTFDVKAHCWLMQQWVENGLIAMLCLLAFYLWYFVQSVRLYRRADLKNGTVQLGLGIFLGTVTYMFVSLANDSNVNTAPMFWIILGLGFAVNRIIVQTEEAVTTAPASKPSTAAAPAPKPAKPAAHVPEPAKPAAGSRQTNTKSRKKNRKKR